MYFVISGYCSPDWYTSDGGPVLKLRVFSLGSEVEEAYRQFKQDTDRNYIDQKVFRVIQGKELKLVPKQVVTEWELSK